MKTTGRRAAYSGVVSDAQEPTAGVVRWLLAEQIKAYRTRAKLTHKDMMGIGLGSVSRWTRLENHRGGVRIDRGDIKLMAEAFSLNAVEAAELEAMLVRAEREESAQVLDVEPNFREYLAFERYATEFKIMAPGVHGLLQTSEYAAAIARLSGDVSEAAIPGVVALRQERQRQAIGRAAIQVTMAEEALLRWIGSAQCMADQREHLRQLAADRLVDIRVHLISVGGLPATRGGATILKLDAGGKSRHLAYIESYLGGAHTDKPRVIANLSRRFAAMQNQSIPIEEYLQ